MKYEDKLIYRFQVTPCDRSIGRISVVFGSVFAGLVGDDTASNDGSASIFQDRRPCAIAGTIGRAVR